MHSGQDFTELITGEQQVITRLVKTMETNSESRHTKMVEVWYKLGNKNASKVKLTGDADVDDLKEAVCKKNPVTLSHVENPSDLDVFAAGTAVPVPEGTESIDPGRKATEFNTTSTNPLIVVAPEPPPQQDGEWSCCSHTASNTVVRF